jgi:hypothetical protein
MSQLAAVLVYAEHDMRVFPVGADGVPLIKWGKGATTDRAMIEGYWRRWPYADCGWSLPEGVVVVDVDCHHAGQNGPADFINLAGMSVDQVEAPQATTPRGGRHIFYATGGKRFRKGYVPHTGVEIKVAVNYVALPLIDNGRGWLKPLLGAALPPAPAWLDVALKREEETRSVAEKPNLPPSDDPQVRYDARVALGRACVRIVQAPCGEQDATRNAECFFIGLLVGRGAIDRDEALAALIRAALAMATYSTPWRNLAERTEKSLQAGIRKAEAAP